MTAEKLGTYAALGATALAIMGWVYTARSAHAENARAVSEHEEVLEKLTEGVLILQKAEERREHRAEWEAEQNGYVPPQSDAPGNLPPGYRVCVKAGEPSLCRVAPAE